MYIDSIQRVSAVIKRDTLTKGRVVLSLLLAATVVVGMGGIFVSAPALAASPGDVIVNEFSSASDPEWVELLNTTGGSISLDGWTIKDLANPPKSLSGWGTIPARGIVVFENHSGWLNNDPDPTETITIFDGADTPIHSVSYGSGEGVAVGAPTGEESAAFDADSIPQWSIGSPSKGWFNDAEDIDCSDLDGDPLLVAPTLDSIDDCLGEDGISTNIGNLDNPSATPATEDEGALYFGDENEEEGKIVFEQTLNLTDEATVNILQELGEKMDTAEGFVSFDSETADAMAASGAKMYMYNLGDLGFTSEPNLIVKDDDGNVIDLEDEDYPAIVSEYDEDEGTLTFTTDHFTQFEVEKGIFGTKWNDLDGDGIRDWEDTNENSEKDAGEEYTEPGIPDWTIVLYNYDLNPGDDGYETEIMTGPNGNYSFTDLDEGEYIVCETRKSDGGWTQTYPDGDYNYYYDGCGEYSEDNEIFGYDVAIGDVVNVSNLDFGNAQKAHIVVRKTAYPASEHAFYLKLYKEELDEESVNFYLSDGGEWSFDVAPGTYTIQEYIPEEYEDYPEYAPDRWRLANVACEYDGNSVGENAGDGKTVTVEAGDEVTCTFTNIEGGVAIITGHKWEDLDGDGEKNEGEPGRKDWTMALGLVMPRDAGTPTIPIEIVALSLTGADGWYYLPLPEQQGGEYKVFEEKRDGWNTTSPSAVDSFFDITYRTGAEPQLVEDSFFDVFVSVVSGQTITEDNDGNPLNFGNFELVDITGFKWNDEDGDGVWDKGEPGLEGVAIALGRVSGESRQEEGHEVIPIEIIAMDLTGSNGDFTLRDIGPGRYGLFEEKMSGWQATNPAPQVVDSFLDITYDLNAIAIGDPDFDLLRIPPGDPDFDLLRSSFFDVFVELSGQNVDHSAEIRNREITIPGVPLQFGNHHELLVISEDTATEVEETSTVIIWTTDFPGTSRVVYDTESHPVLGSAPNYGYASSTATFDEDPKMESHSVSISGLSAGTTYYYRTISAASPESVGSEGSFTTAGSAPAASLGGGGSGWYEGGGSGFVLGESISISTSTPTSTEPAVLGESTACIPEYLTSYLYYGRSNNPGQVTKLQQFLNEKEGNALPVTGYFGKLTRAAVKSFQLKYASEILAPWGITEPSGNVYKTTRWKVNSLMCPSVGYLPPQVP